MDVAIDRRRPRLDEVLGSISLDEGLISGSRDISLVNDKGSIYAEIDGHSRGSGAEAVFYC